MSSPFLQVPSAEWVAANALAFAIRDKFPVSPGHTLVIPRRVIATWFEATTEERLALFDLVDVVKAELDATLQPDGYNVGFNAGAAAGQTVFHLHVHVIPRFRGDMDDPRGGIRHAIPSRGNYSAGQAKTLTVGGRDPFIVPLKDLFLRATEVSIVAAFVQKSGVDRVRDLIEAALGRGVRIRILTGDYLHLTQAEALEELLDWMTVGPRVEDEHDDREASAEEDDASAIEEGRSEGPGGAERAREHGHAWSGEASLAVDLAQDASAASWKRSANVAEGAAPLLRGGRLEARVVEVDGLPPPTRSFHPKSWRFEGPRLAALFVGSSNLSSSALESGVEWNLRIDRDRAAWARAVEVFEAHWAAARELDRAWLAVYAARAAQAQKPELTAGEVEVDELFEPPEPHEVQREALAALEGSRAGGHRRGLVVLATGLGKTWLGAWDVAQVEAKLGRWPRVLFVAHRQELLRQAARTFRALVRRRGDGSWVRPPPRALRMGWCAGASDDLEGDVVFASVAKLSRPERLALLDPNAFDYVVIDEVHHATAPSYRRILDHMDPEFVLGLTATPERADEADLLGLFDDHLVYRADLDRGIAIGRLVPFRYFGLKDDVDYANIPGATGVSSRRRSLEPSRPSSAWRRRGPRGTSTLGPAPSCSVRAWPTRTSRAIGFGRGASGSTRSTPGPAGTTAGPRSLGSPGASCKRCAPSTS